MSTIRGTLGDTLRLPLGAILPHRQLHGPRPLMGFGDPGPVSNDRIGLNLGGSSLEPRSPSTGAGRPATSRGTPSIPPWPTGSRGRSTSSAAIRVAAKRLLTEAIAQLWKFDYRQAVAQFTAALADAHRLAGDLQEARRLATDALALGRDTEFPLAVAWAQRALGRVALAAGNHAAADAALTAALETAHAMRAELEVARCRLARAEIAVRAADPAAAAADLRDAYRLFTRMGAARYLERVRALAATLPVDLDDGGGR